jgi:hypothetical protein
MCRVVLQAVEQRRRSDDVAGPGEARRIVRVGRRAHFERAKHTGTHAAKRREAWVVRENDEAWLGVEHPGRRHQWRHDQRRPGVR